MQGFFVATVVSDVYVSARHDMNCRLRASRSFTFLCKSIDMSLPAQAAHACRLGIRGTFTFEEPFHLRRKMIGIARSHVERGAAAELSRIWSLNGHDRNV
jgi:hypothetical protein